MAKRSFVASAPFIVTVGLLPACGGAATTSNPPAPEHENPPGVEHTNNPPAPEADQDETPDGTDVEAEE